MYATSRMKKELSTWSQSVTGLRGLARERALQKANALSGQQAHEIWTAMQILESNSRGKELHGYAVEMAINLKLFREALKVVAFKGILFKRLSSKRNR